MKQKINEVQNLKFKDKWRLLVHNIIRPPRKVYSPSDLGDQSFQYEGRLFRRLDYIIMHNEKKISLSIFTTDANIKNTILYLHSNASNKLQAIQLLQYLPEQFCLACFDFFGCGVNQQSNTITLGIEQAQQTRSVIQHLRGEQYRVVLWGRSMGAATALICGQAQIIVADSPFSSFKYACKQISLSYSPLLCKPLLLCFFNCIFYKLKKDVNKQGKFNIGELNILSYAKKLNKQVYLILLSGDKDQVVSQKNSKMIYNAFKGKTKHFQIFQGTHNSRRPKQMIQKIMNLIKIRFEAENNNKISQTNDKVIQMTEQIEFT